jgi:hypothetical protein
MLQLRPFRTLVITNIEEYYRPVMAHLSGLPLREWRSPSQVACDLGFFWGGDSKLVITPHRVPTGFPDAVRRVLHRSDIQVVTPASTGALLCKEILQDEALMDALVAAGRQRTPLHVIAWGETPELHDLLTDLRTRGACLTAEVGSRERLWVSRYFGSKSGLRDLCSGSPELAAVANMPDGFTCADVGMACQVALGFARHRPGVAIKADQGAGGNGVLLCPSEWLLSDGGDRRLALHARFAPVLSAGPIVVEEYIERTPDRFGSPSIQMLVGGTDQAAVLCTAAQRTTATGAYGGAVVGKGVIPSWLGEKLHRLGEALGRSVSRLGYQGVFGVDTVVDSDGKLYCLEVNARRTFVSHVAEIGVAIFGPRWQEKATFATCERCVYPGLPGRSFAEIDDLLRPVRFPLSGQPRGVVITIASSLENYTHVPELGLVAIGSDVEDAAALFEEAGRLLGAP